MCDFESLRTLCSKLHKYKYTTYYTRIRRASNTDLFDRIFPACISRKIQTVQADRLEQDPFIALGFWQEKKRKFCVLFCLIWCSDDLLTSQLSAIIAQNRFRVAEVHLDKIRQFDYVMLMNLSQSDRLLLTTPTAKPRRVQSKDTGMAGTITEKSYAFTH